MVFPPASSGDKIPGLKVAGTLPAALMTNEGRIDANAAPTTLAATRTLTIPEWMTVKASGTAAGAHEIVPLAASGSLPSGQFGIGRVRRPPVICCSIPIGSMRWLRRSIWCANSSRPAQLRIVSTGTFLAMPAPADAKISTPDGSTAAASRDQWGRLRMRPVQPGNYSIESAGWKDRCVCELLRCLRVRFDRECDGRRPPWQAMLRRPPIRFPRSSRCRPLSAILIILALVAIVLESALLLRTANRWGMRHV